MRCSLGSVSSPFCDAVSLGARWRQIAEAVRGSVAPWSSGAFGALYRMAMAEGRRALRRFRGVDAARAEDLASDVLFGARQEIVAAENPLAYFRTALTRAAISWTRKGSARVAEETEARRDAGPLDAAERSAIYRMDAGRRLGAMMSRERAVLLAVAAGDGREEIAERLGTSRANVDQIVHRARARWGGAGDT